MFTNISATDLGGQTTIEAALERYERKLMSRVPERVHRLLTYRVENEILAGPAFGGEGPTFTLGLGPVATADATKLKLYRVVGNDDGSKPSVCPGVNTDNQTGTLGGTGNTTLTLTGSSTTLNEGEYLLATYVIDPTDATFELTNYADYVVYATAAELGAKVSTAETDTDPLVVTYQELAQSYLDELEKNGFVDNSIRSLEFCDEIEPADGTIGSVRKGRA